MIGAVTLQMLRAAGAFLLPYAIKGLLISAIVGAIWNAGYRSARHKCQLAAKDATIAAGRVDNAAAADAATQTDQAQQDAATDAVAAEREVHDYADHLKGKPSGACILDADDVRWLREPAREDGSGARKR